MDPLPEIIRQALEEPGSGVLLSFVENVITPFPSSALLYMFHRPVVSQSLPSRLPDDLVEAESLEIKQKDYQEAIRAYRKLLDTAETEMRSLLLQRLARTLRKANRLGEAAEAYRNLENMDTVWLGGLPSDFIARFELCTLAAEQGELSDLKALSFALYRDLVGGRWLIDKSRYLYYSDRCCSWCRESHVQAGEFNHVKVMEERKLALTRAAEAFSSEPIRILGDGVGTYLGFWRSDPLTAVILSEDYLRSQWWPRLVSAQGKDLDSILLSSDGHVLFGSIAIDAPPPFAVAQDIRIDGTYWRIQVWPRNPEAIQTDVRQRQNLFLSILVFVLVLLIFGSYITVRIVRRELEISRMRADFVSMVSHEFRSPLTGIRHLGEMLLDDQTINRTKQHRYFKMIVQESIRLTRLVENILDFSRMEEGRKEYRFEKLNTSRWLIKIIDDFEAEISAEGVTVETDIPDELPLISADREALGSAVHNLLDNAVKYSPQEKVVWISVKALAGAVRISVRDKGVGISEHDRKHIFDRFYRADGEISKRIKGAGLGLSLVRHIIAAHGGKLECESKVGEGSTFYIRLPAETVKGGGSDE